MRVNARRLDADGDFHLAAVARQTIAQSYMTPEIVLLMGSVNCPECSARLKWTAVRFGEPFRCPACGCTLEVPDGYMTAAHWVSVLSALTIAYFLSSGLGSMIVAVVVAYW